MQQPFGPRLANAVEVGIAVGDAMLPGTAEAAAAVEQRIQRQADGQITAQRRINGDQRAAHRLLQRRVDGQHPIDDRFAVFAFANLEIRRVAGGFNKVALRINMEQTMGFAGDLAAKQQVAVEVGVTAGLLVAAVALITSSSVLPISIAAS